MSNEYYAFRSGIKLACRLVLKEVKGDEIDRVINKHFADVLYQTDLEDIVLETCYGFCILFTDFVGLPKRAQEFLMEQQRLREKYKGGQASKK